MSFSEQLFEGIKEYATPKEISWIESKAKGSLQSLQTAFVATPRFISKTPIISTSVINDVSINGWSLDRLVRVYLLTTLRFYQEVFQISTHPIRIMVTMIEGISGIVGVPVPLVIARIRASVLSPII